MKKTLLLLPVLAIGGEAYLTNGDKELAMTSYKKSLELNPSNTNAIEMLKQSDGK